MMHIDPSVPELFTKLRKPYEDTLRVLGVKDVDTYLPTIDEAAKIAQAQSQKPPSPQEQEMSSKVAVNTAKVKDTEANTAFTIRKTQDMDTDDYFEALAAKRGRLNAVEID